MRSCPSLDLAKSQRAGSPHTVMMLLISLSGAQYKLETDWAEPGAQD